MFLSFLPSIYSALSQGLSVVHSRNVNSFSPDLNIHFAPIASVSLQPSALRLCLIISVLGLKIANIVVTIITNTIAIPLRIQRLLEALGVSVGDRFILSDILLDYY